MARVRARSSQRRGRPDPTPPRLYAIVATRAPVAVVFRRGPSKRWLIYRWDLTTGKLESGASFAGIMYPRKCELSPDGTLLAYLVEGRPRAFASRGRYGAISKLPWLFALAAWTEVGAYFVEGAPELQAGSSDAKLTVDGAWYEQVIGGVAYERWRMPAPDHGDVAPVKARYELGRSEGSKYAPELRRGWVHRSAMVLERPHPAGRLRLVLSDRGRDQHPDLFEEGTPTYRIENGRDVVELQDVCWADWDARGRLLVATRSGLLQARDGGSPELTILQEHDLGPVHVARRTPAPDWARRW